MSSDSNSKRSSNSSRKKYRKKSAKKKSALDSLKSKKELRPVVTDNDRSTNLVALVLGMVTTLVLLFGIFSDRVENEGYAAKQQLRKDERRKEKKADTLEELLIKLTKLGDKKDTPFTSADTCKKRIEISKAILDRGPADENMREVAVCEGILAQVKLYGLDFAENMGIEDVGESLKSAYEPYLEDDNAEIYENARIALLTHRSFESMKSENDDISELVTLFADTINRFPQSKHVSSMIEAHLFALIEKDLDYAQRLYSAVRERNPMGALDPRMETGMRNIADRLLLKKENFNHKFSDRWANGVAGRRELVKTSSRLLNEPNGGLFLLRRLATLSEWFERNEFYEEARAVYEGFSSAADRGNIVAEHRDIAKRLGKSGLQRISLDGQAISFRGIDSNGKRLVDAEMKEKVVIVLFWSIKSDISIRYLVELNGGATSFGNKPVSVLAVCVDEELAAVAKQMRTAPIVQIIESNFLSEKNSLIEMCPPGNLPHLMLVGLDGVVADVNADPMQIKEKAMQILFERNRRN